jgi:hypothetical protein
VGVVLHCFWPPTTGTYRGSRSERSQLGKDPRAASGSFCLLSGPEGNEHRSKLTDCRVWTWGCMDAFGTGGPGQERKCAGKVLGLASV